MIQVNITDLLKFLRKFWVYIACGCIVAFFAIQTSCIKSKYEKCQEEVDRLRSNNEILSGNMESCEELREYDQKILDGMKEASLERMKLHDIAIALSNERIKRTVAETEKIRGQISEFVQENKDLSEEERCQHAMSWAASAYREAFDGYNQQLSRLPSE